MRLLVRIALVLLLVLGIWRLGRFCWWFARDSLQRDFAAMYTAGEAVSAGASPYINFIAREPPIWDGDAQTRHSRFLYPPLAALFFQPLTRMPYHVAKIVWMGISLLACAISFELTRRMVGPIGITATLFAAIVAVFFQPLICLLERGQVDAITGLLIFIAATCAIAKRRSALIWTGLMLALATVLKLHVVCLIPLLMLRKHWGIVGSYVVWGSVLLVLTIAVFGTPAVSNYISVELPRISRYGESGTLEMLLDSKTVGLRTRGEKDGKVYPLFATRFALNATLVRPLVTVAQRVGRDISHGTVAIVVYLLSAMLLSLLLRKHLIQLHQDPLREATWWYLMLTLVLLTAPLTWSMNVVWLLPLPLVLCAWWRRRGQLDCGQIPSLLLGFLGLVLVATPDLEWYLPRNTLVHALTIYKYIAGEMLIAASLLGLLRGDPAPAGA